MAYNCIYLSSRSGGQKPGSNLSQWWAEITVSAGPFPLGGSEGSSVSSPLLASGGRLHPLAPDLFLALLQPLLPVVHLLLPPLKFSPPSYKGPLATFKGHLNNPR